jgi:hypothetical protein
MDTKPGLDPHQDHLDRLQEFGYNEQEAHFLYLAAVHSGYFTRRQCLSFTHQTKGCLVHRFTTKLLTQHAQAAQYGHKTYVLKLTSRKIYDLIGKQDLRDHRLHTADFIRKRLLVLDFALAHPDLRYLESQEEKLKFFREQLGLPASLSPGRTDIAKGLDGARRCCDRSQGLGIDRLEVEERVLEHWNPSVRVCFCRRRTEGNQKQKQLSAYWRARSGRASSMARAHSFSLARGLDICQPALSWQNTIHLPNPIPTSHSTGDRACLRIQEQQASADWLAYASAVTRNAAHFERRKCEGTQSQLRRSTPKITLELYAQAVSADQQKAHRKVVQMVLPARFSEKLRARSAAATI